MMLLPRDRLRDGPATARLLTLLYRDGPCGRSDATRRLGLSRSSTGEAVAELVRLGLIRVSEAQPPEESRPGRPSTTLDLAPDGPIAVGARLSGGGITTAVLGMDHRPLAIRTRPVDAAALSPAEVLRIVVDEATALLAGQERRCVGLGLAVPGIVRESDGTVRLSLQLDWHEVPAAEILANHLPPELTVTVNRDAVLAALAERRHGPRSTGSLLVLYCDHIGIGGALLHGNAPPADIGFPLELGHITVDPSGAECPCGLRGCVELYVDGRAVLRAAGREDLLDADAARAVLAPTRDGDPEAAAAARLVGAELGAVLAMLINVVGPQTVVLTGLLARLHRVAPAEVRSCLRTSTVARMNATRLLCGSVEEPVLVGAAETVFAPLLHDPAGVVERAISTRSATPSATRSATRSSTSAPERETLGSRPA
ncbi:ROK family transcriptional regulator [Embleya sp. AB8]|uniref:ROK family transcriptional regulator n=1 Tax=Embleya sp. AB8 TaxID=3156304 RepID=UPI003C745653